MVVIVLHINMKVIYSGLESSGKSLQLAQRAEELVIRNKKWFRKTKEVRPIYSNMKFSESFEKWATKKMGIPIIYWSNLEELIKVSEADVICDEVGNYFDSRMWASLSLDVRRWLTQGAKHGIHFYGGAQDFAQVDKSFRRLVQPGDLIHITKLMGSARPSRTTPSVKYIWGLCLVRKLNPQGYDEDKKQFTSSSVFPSFFTIKSEYCRIFDTNQSVGKSTPPPLRHVVQYCELKNCSFRKESHV